MIGATVRLAIPNKGRISEPVRQMIQKSGIYTQMSGERKLIAKTNDPGIEVLFARPIDIPEYVAEGAADLGITGHDMVTERKSDVRECLDLGLGKAKVVLAVPEESTVRSSADLDGLKIATEFPAIARSYFSKAGVKVTIVPVGGACEAAPLLGIADAIVDLSSSGVTLKTNRLRVVDVILESSTVVISSKNTVPEKQEKINEIILAFESVINARGQCYLMMNVKRNALDSVKMALPGLSGPTIMDVASDEDLVAVHAVISEERSYQVINQLKHAGARDILVMPIYRMIR